MSIKWTRLRQVLATFFTIPMQLNRLRMSRPLPPPQGWISKDPRNAALLKLAEQGGWMHQFRVVVLLRVSPFPYALFNCEGRGGEGGGGGGYLILGADNHYRHLSLHGGGGGSLLVGRGGR